MCANLFFAEPVVVKAEPGGGFSNVPLPATAIERPKASADILQRQVEWEAMLRGR